VRFFQQDRIARSAGQFARASFFRVSVRFADGFPVASGFGSAEDTEEMQEIAERKARAKIHRKGLWIFLCVLRLFLSDLCGFPA
jgi:hypothetical protein